MSDKVSLVTIVSLACLLFGTRVVGAAGVASVTLSESVTEPALEPINVGERFSTEVAEIHAVVELEGQAAGTRVKGVWISVDAINVPDYEIGAYELVLEKATQKTVHFSLSRPDNGWPVGNYRLDIHLDGRIAAISPFSITPSTARPAAPVAPQFGGASASRGASAPGAAPAPAPPPTPAPAPAGSFSGTYTMNAPGVSLTLVMNQDAQGAITGTLSSTSGGQFQLDGMVQDGVAVGACYGQEGGALFEAYPQGGQLAFYLIEPDETGNVAGQNARELIFTRSGGSTAPGRAPRHPTAAPPAGNHPLGGGQSGSPLAGNWRCSGSDGQYILAFDSDSRMVFNGQPLSYSMLPGVIRVQGDYGPVDYRYSIDGGTLSIAGPDGFSLHCAR